MAQCSLSISRIRQPLAGLSSTETGLNGEHAVLHKLLRFYTFKMSVDIVMLPELLWRSSFICLSCQGLGQVFLLDTSSIRLHVLFLREPNLQTQTFAFPVKWSSYRLLKAWSSRTLKVAGGYDNFAHNKAAAAAAVSLLTWAGLNAPSLHIKNTTVYAQHLISHLKTRPTIIVLKKISEIMQQQKNNN